MDACCEIIRSDKVASAYGDSVEYFLIKGSTSSDIELYKAKIEQDLRTLRVTVDAKPSYSPDVYNIGEKLIVRLISQDVREIKKIRENSGNCSQECKKI